MTARRRSWRPNPRSPAVAAAFLRAEIAFGVIFLIEYVARLWSVSGKPGPDPAWAKRWRFARSPIGMIDLIVMLASLFPFLVTSAPILSVARLLRLASLMQFGRFSMALREIGRAVSERRYDLFVTLALAGAADVRGLLAGDAASSRADRRAAQVARALS